ncbi:MAG: hypothetical protein ACD_28C00014G0001 [uncultured bacterium]|nr:MAG: hypothetical protein ACD_28C00014G0001 [uncultured bacterium]KKT74846.1 MAG: hypothetical protein UW70_C0044G0016 [Candidatus Peregrinibacteria bacterium GW2011_GWA2_44_7]
MISAFSVRRETLKEAAIVLGLMSVGLLLFNVLGIDMAHAQLISPEDSPDNITTATGGEGSFRTLARTIVNFFLYFLGFVATIMVIYGGILYVTSAGNDENVGKAKKILLYALVGIIVILLSFAIVNTVLTAGTGSSATT